MSLSIDLRASSWLASAGLLVAGIQRQDTTANSGQGSEVSGQQSILPYPQESRSPSAVLISVP
jgi:hypothetical protein